MTVKISHKPEIQAFLNEASGADNDLGNARVKTLIHRILLDSVKIIEDLQVTPEEFWAGVNYLNVLGARQEAGLLAAGLGLEHYLDLLLDAADEEAGKVGGTPRTIEGPLYVAGAPICQAEARLDDGADDGVVMFVRGQVKDLTGKPVAGATVDVWHANTAGTYSYFDPSQSEFNLRRRIITDAEGCYRFRSIVPSGYGCSPDGPTQHLLNQLGRHGQRPAHIHFFLSAPGPRHLTTQINLSGEKYLYDDFAYATRDGLVGEITVSEDQERARAHGVTGRFAELEFNFTMQMDDVAQEQARGKRVRALEA